MADEAAFVFTGHPEDLEAIEPCARCGETYFVCYGRALSDPVHVFRCGCLTCFSMGPASRAKPEALAQWNRHQVADAGRSRLNEARDLL
jgi:hypothetical protein